MVKFSARVNKVLSRIHCLKTPDEMEAMYYDLSRRNEEDVTTVGELFFSRDLAKKANLKAFLVPFPTDVVYTSLLHADAGLLMNLDRKGRGEQ